ncbi:MAG: hypothetical protein LBU65_12595 [Planctomycetaceae bacterium]|jgi:hypothetical protein|nr:hypothetical protein [Planctomycetaceae bacterium]
MSKTLPRLAVGIIARNDAPRLEAVIHEANKLTKHVFVIDVDSSDNSYSVAARCGATVVKVAWNNNYSEIRNQLMEYVEASGVADWILWLSPNERFDDVTRKEFDNFFTNERNMSQAYVLVLHRCYLSSQEYGQFIAGDSLEGVKNERDEETLELRLLPLYRNIRYRGRICESAFASLNANEISLAAAPGRVQIVRQLDNNREVIRRANETIAILKVQEKLGEPITDEQRLQRGIANIELQTFAAAREDLLYIFHNSIHRNLQLEAVYRINESYAMLPPRTDEQSNMLVDAIQVFKLDFQLLTSLGLHLQRNKHQDLAIRALETALSYGQIAYDVWHRRHIREVAVLALTTSYCLTGNHRLAAKTLEMNLNEVEDRLPLALRLLDLYIAMGLENRAQQLVSIIWNDDTRETMRDVITGACRAAAGAWDAAILPLESLYLSGCRSPICLRWYALSLLATKRVSEAMPVLNDWCTAEPSNIEARSYLYAADNPEHFEETLKEIQEKQMEALGLVKAETSMPIQMMTQTVQAANQSQDKEIALAVLGVKEGELTHAAALKELIELSPLAAMEKFISNHNQ